MESCQRRPRISEGRRSSEEARVATRRRSRNSSHIRGGRDRVLPFFSFPQFAPTRGRTTRVSFLVEGQIPGSSPGATLPRR